MNLQRYGQTLALGCAALAMMTVPGSPAAVAQSEDAGPAIRAVLTKQAADWNRGDLDAFASGYKRSPEILFMGKTLARGYDQMVASYKARYPTPEARGVLRFADLEVQPLDARFATATGRFHLQRTAGVAAMPTATFCWCWKRRPTDGRSFATIVRRTTRSSNGRAASRSPKRPGKMKV